MYRTYIKNLRVINPLNLQMLLGFKWTDRLAIGRKYDDDIAMNCSFIYSFRIFDLQKPKSSTKDGNPIHTRCNTCSSNRILFDQNWCLFVIDLNSIRFFFVGVSEMVTRTYDYGDLMDQLIENVHNNINRSKSFLSVTSSYASKIIGCILHKSYFTTIVSKSTLVWLNEPQKFKMKN